MKKLFKLLLTIALICAIVYFAPKLVHKCDGCEQWFIGPGYEASVLVDAVTDDDQTICRDCAEKHHIVEVALGTSVDDFRKNLFD